MAASATKTVAANKTLVIDCLKGTFSGPLANTPVYLQLMYGVSDTVLMPDVVGAPAAGMGGYGDCGYGIKVPIGQNIKVAFSSAGTTGTYQTVWVSGCIE